MLEFSETLELIKTAKLGDNDAKTKLISENSPLIKSVIKRYLNKGLEYDDLYQLGCLGFLKAISNFDESFNVRFSTYAVPMIAGEIKRFMRDNGIIKVSRSVKSLAIQINRFREQYCVENEKQPSVAIIAKEFDVTEHEVVFAMESINHPLSLQSVVGDDEGGRQQQLIDKIPNEHSVDTMLDNFLLVKTIKELPTRERKIIILRYFRGKTQKEIADIIGVSQVQVSRIENKVLDLIKIKMADDIV